ncbi:MAG: ATP synthase subunit C, partial [Acidaminobacteraceae bacterium]
STGMATIGAGYAVGAVGSSALGAVSENPKILGKTLIFVGLAEGIAIYGLIISILILGRL